MEELREATSGPVFVQGTCGVKCKNATCSPEELDIRYHGHTCVYAYSLTMYAAALTIVDNI
jgi:hypothetical protein